MSKLGFDKALRRLAVAEKRFFVLAMQAAQKEFKTNFDTESNVQTGQSWDMVVRGYPPPILDVTGELRAETLSRKNISYFRNKAVLTVDPIDNRGRGYASYHQEGFTHKNGTEVEARKFLTQSRQLDRIQLNHLYDCAEWVFIGFVSRFIRT